MALVRESQVESPMLPGHAVRPSGGGAARWLWAGLAFAIGLFIGGGGPLAWTAVAAMMLAGLVGVAHRQRWARSVLWIGTGLCLGLCLHLTLALVRAEEIALIPGVG